MRMRDRFLPIFTAAALAASFAVPAKADSRLYQLNRETDDGTIVLARSLSLTDCGIKAMAVRDRFPDDEITCTLEWTDSPAVDPDDGDDSDDGEDS